MKIEITKTGVTLDGIQFVFENGLLTSTTPNGVGGVHCRVFTAFGGGHNQGAHDTTLAIMAKHLKIDALDSEHPESHVEGAFYAAHPHYSNLRFSWEPPCVGSHWIDQYIAHQLDKPSID
jgi:hypothetical protein